MSLDRPPPFAPSYALRVTEDEPQRMGPPVGLGLEGPSYRKKIL